MRCRVKLDPLSICVCISVFSFVSRSFFLLCCSTAATVGHLGPRLCFVFADFNFRTRSVAPLQSGAAGPPSTAVACEPRSSAVLDFWQLRLWSAKVVHLQLFLSEVLLASFS